MDGLKVGATMDNGRRKAVLHEILGETNCHSVLEKKIAAPFALLWVFLDKAIS